MSTSATLSSYVMMSPEGEAISIPSGLFEAIKHFMVSDKPPVEKPTGHIEVHFRAGGIAGIETVEKKKFNGFSK